MKKWIHRDDGYIKKKRKTNLESYNRDGTCWELIPILCYVNEGFIKKEQIMYFLNSPEDFCDQSVNRGDSTFLLPKMRMTILNCR